MRAKHPYGAVALLCAGFLFLAPCLSAQTAAASRHVGVPQGWSDHNVVFSLEGLARHPNLIYQEPRVRHQVMQRFQSSEFFRGLGPTADYVTTSHHRDWSVNLVRGHISANMYPAKYSFDPGAPPSCANDYVVFGLNVAGATAGQANLVAFNNLYSGTGGMCGAAPTVMFAYNVTTVKGGKVELSPVISEDGTKIAFAETVGTSTVFHVLTWTAGQGTITKAAAPATMTSLTIPATSTTSSPWVDYANDIAYMGVDGGSVYKIKGVFNTTPSLAAFPWPVLVSGGHHLTPPVLDNQLGMLMVGSANGNLYQLNVATTALAVVAVGAHGGTSPGIAAPPIVDVTNGTTFVTAANDGTSGVLVEVDTATLIQLAKGRIGLGAAGGTALSIPQPAFDNNYYNNPTTGVVHLCGTGLNDTTPWQYSFGFLGRTMIPVSVFAQQLLNSTAATCTGWTEFFNPNVGAGGTDFFFFGLTQDCTGTGTSGCAVALTTDLAPMVTAPVVGGPSGIVVDNYSTAGQASSVYLSGEAENTAYKFTQNGLQ